MRWLLILLIRVYRKLPDRFKRQCLFKETCSVFVLRAAKVHGFVAGCHALKHRYSLCRYPYLVYYDYRICEWQVVLADKTTKSGAEIADCVLESYRRLSACTLDNPNRAEEGIEITDSKTAG